MGSTTIMVLTLGTYCGKPRILSLNFKHKTAEVALLEEFNNIPSEKDGRQKLRPLHITAWCMETASGELKLGVYVLVIFVHKYILYIVVRHSLLSATRQYFEIALRLF